MIGSVRAWLILVISAIASAQNYPPRPIFPSDGLGPKEAGGAEILEAVCPGQVLTDDRIRCRTRCPQYTGFAESEVDWVLARVTRGHFLAPVSDDAILWIEGCEPHSRLYGGSILLTRKSGTWKMLWYKAGVKTDQCHKIALRTGREVLICIDDNFFPLQGYVATTLYAEDLRAPRNNWDVKPLFSIADSVASCGSDSRDKSNPDPLFRGYIERIAFGPQGMLSLVVFYGKRAMMPADVRSCSEGTDLSPAAKRVEIDFLFDGKTYRVAPQSRAAAREFGR
jgi:hypothetical protein